MSSLNEYPFLIKLVKNLIEKEKFKADCDIVVTNGTEKGEGFLGEIYFITFKDTNKTLNIVAKSSLRNENIRKHIAINDIYLNEINFYVEIYPCFQIFLENIGASHPFNSIPKFYGHSLENGTETIGLENLLISGFKVFNRKLCFDKNHINLVFKHYAQFHAISFAIKDQKPDVFKALVKKIRPVFMDMAHNSSLGKGMNTSIHAIYENLQEHGNPELLMKLEIYLNNCGKIFQDCFKYDGKYSAILHGDCWSNNMMIKYKETNSEKIPVDLKFLDFQLLFCSTPVFDLSYSFYSSASKEEVHNLDSYLKLYYENFSIYVKDLGSDPETVYPFEALKEEWKNYSKFGFLMSLLLHKLKLTDKEDAKDVNDLISERTGFSEMYDKTEYMSRVENLVVHLSNIDAL